MALVPSIKGSVFVRVVEDIAKLTAAGTLSRNELKRKLPPADLALLDQPVTASGWYDVQAYGRLLEILKESKATGTTSISASAAFVPQNSCWRQASINRWSI